MTIMVCLNFMPESEADRHQELDKLKPPCPHRVIDTEGRLMIEKPKTRDRVLSERLKHAPEKK
ncbi:uncharacterized protein MELLADRAFT_54606 [Melampsora larici-populina 98AG31]|uniref:Uncharacterized protein n=1 Tax=Melampsora larici-populina (strain 98AG31 / pathotype 3-4-7) TaxID=747676 RepID=F4R678_MELLP|nr:uncharacterized protein MELLADRAFT_54606 [Melampsora larici-populina 98AG31]EGG11835.1 hypothetical protein MELLADRAFT_54606 [Melampsora larici-populina 98AG31]